MGIGVSGTDCIGCGILVGIAIGVWGGKLHWMWNFGGHSHRGLGGQVALDVEFWWA